MTNKRPQEYVLEVSFDNNELKHMSEVLIMYFAAHIRYTKE